MDCPATQLGDTHDSHEPAEQKESGVLGVIYAICGRNTKGAHLLESMLRIDFAPRTIRVCASTAGLIVLLHESTLK